MITKLPAAPKHYSDKDQNQVRRLLMQALREIEQRLLALESA